MLNRKIVVLAAGVLALAVTAFVSADQLNACDKTKTASASGCTESAAAFYTAAAAEVTAGKGDCCKTAVASFIASCLGNTGVHAKTAGAGALCDPESCSPETCKQMYTAVTAGTSPCCKATVSAFMARIGCASAATTASVKSGCAVSTTASARSGCTRSTVSSSLVAWGGDRCSYKAEASAADVAISDLPYRKGEEVVLSGSAVCGSCNLHITDGCTSLFQTADGKIYRIYKTDTVNNMRKVSEKNDVKIFATVRNYDGVKYLEVESFVVI